MSKKYRNLFERIVADGNMRRALHLTRKGRRLSAAALDFKEFSEVNLANLARDIRDGTYRPDPIRQFTIFEPKPRLISIHSFRDRVVQHALVGVIGPIFEATFLPNSYACRKGRGTHSGVVALQAAMRRLQARSDAPLYALKTDFAKYFHSIDREEVHRLIRRKVSCAATLRLIEAITPPTGDGLPIGSLTSQLYANIYGTVVDRHVHFELGERYWFRYMDDVVVLGHDPQRLRAVCRSIEDIAARQLKLSLSKWSVQNVARGVNFLGYRVWPRHKLLRRQSVDRAKRKIARYRDRGQVEDLRKFTAAWRGHAQWADTYNLRKYLELVEDDRNANHQFAR